ncbi:MAG: flagellar biosynthetic protein FliO [Roseomonas sp.]|nr:flagellar biosynthetic protein FliO [Roseomonas sp.]MCA3326059.1 flagellar biosynthetic protein FliO [Roseomonas sp.]MCA3332228.1 flagellar biosynthetic protein FliO [Roseomonas sp.]MCA3335459.1 flagellar biosynthetic protein FliO [Roseomonas sp.]MCA3347508.1 flagellar biosynthetic protein FliO [Roseomonas sp.]
MNLSLADWLTASLSLLFVLGLILLLARLLRATGLAPQIAGQRLKLQEVLALDARRRVIILRCDGREVLLLTGGPQDVCLGWLPPKNEDTSQP